jgi:hypothetical protein
METKQKTMVIGNVVGYDTAFKELLFTLDGDERLFRVKAEELKCAVNEEKTQFLRFEKGSTLYYDSIDEIGGGYHVRGASLSKD